MSEQRTDLSRRGFIQLALYGSAGACVGSMVVFGAPGTPAPTSVDDMSNFEWGFIVDITRCIGCGSCVRACQQENSVPDSFFRTWVERYEMAGADVYVDSPDGAKHSFKQNRLAEGEAAKAFFVPKLCNHCRRSACTQVCPVGASFHSPDGVVLIDKTRCIGCGYCVQACPYGCRYINHEIGVADKCTLCYHRIQKGKPTACVGACPRGARVYGNLKDPESPIRKALRDREYMVLKPDMGTDPKCYYFGLDLEVK